MFAVRSFRALALTAIAVFCLIAVAVAPAEARTKKPKVKSYPVGKAYAAGNAPLVGIGDNNAPMFSDPNYRALGLKIARRIVPYDFWQDPTQLADLHAWVDGAVADNVQPLISLEHSYVNVTKLPSIPEYTKSIQYLLANFPAVRTISPWNEANHVSQPTYKNPKRAAQYYNTVRSLCPGCTIVAADVLDQPNMLPWVKTFLKTAKQPKIWGLHSYGDSNKNIPWNKSATKKLLAAVPGNIWLTEVGGIVAFKFNFPYNEQRAATSTTKALNIAMQSKRIQRVYLYCWYGVDDNTATAPYPWDSGFVSIGHVPRPAYNALASWLATH